MNKHFYLFLLIAVFFSSCKVFNPSIMLRTGKNYEYDIPPDSVSPEYQISENDIVKFRLFSNDGFKLIDLTIVAASNSNNVIQSGGLSYDVEFDGKIKLPILGRIPLAGLTIRQAEKLLEDRYSEFYNDPFALVEVSNKRIIVFSGSGSAAQVINISGNNTTLIEGLALAGGITNTGKAHRIKLIRGDPADPEVYLIDLSTIEGLKDGSMVLQANDIIYVEPYFRVAREVLSQLTPIVSLLTSTIIIISAINTLGKQ